MKSVGRFSMEAGVVSGPAEYMAARGNAKVAKMLAGEDMVFNMGLLRNSDPEVAALVALHSDYVAYESMKPYSGSDYEKRAAAAREKVRKALERARNKAAKV